MFCKLLRLTNTMINCLIHTWCIGITIVISPQNLFLFSRIAKISKFINHKRTLLPLYIFIVFAIEKPPPRCSTQHLVATVVVYFRSYNFLFLPEQPVTMYQSVRSLASTKMATATMTINCHDR